MNRRKFLLTAGAAGVTLAVAPKLLASDRGYHSYVFPLDAMEPKVFSIAMLANAFGEIHKDNLLVANMWLHPDDAPAYNNVMAATYRDYAPASEESSEFLGFLWGAHVWTLPGLKERGTVWVSSDYHKSRVKLVGHRTDRTGTGLIYPDSSRATDAANDTHVMSTVRDSILTLSTTLQSSWRVSVRPVSKSCRPAPRRPRNNG